MKVLIANRGEIAVRVLTAAREAGLRGVAVFSDADAKALHVEIADEAIHLPGQTLAETYLNSDAIIAAAQSSGAKGIHPGYGFLAENAHFAEVCRSCRIEFIGPSVEAMNQRTHVQVSDYTQLKGSDGHCCSPIFLRCHRQSVNHYVNFGAGCALVKGPVTQSTRGRSQCACISQNVPEEGFPS